MLRDFIKLLLILQILHPDPTLLKDRLDRRQEPSDWREHCDYGGSQHQPRGRGIRLGPQKDLLDGLEE